MAIDHKDFMHGAALVAIADSSDFTALNKASDKYGHYIVNADRHIFIKYADSKKGEGYLFTFQRSDKEQIGRVPNPLVYAVLVCDNEVITAITRDELEELIDLKYAPSEAIKVLAEPGRQLRIVSGDNRLPAIPRNAFPARMLT